jgi:DSBA-like thioredoxin domain
MEIQFYFEPSCPFCWITSRWLLQISSRRDVRIEWKPFSLAMKNNELAEDTKASPNSEAHISAHRVLRVMLAAQESGASLIDLYTRFGISFHLGEEKYSNELISEILEEYKLPEELLIEADNTKYDKELEKNINEAVSVVGKDIGVPTIIFTNIDGKKQGYFGPVLEQLPELEDSLKIWDAIATLSTQPSFYELKRSRPDAMPDVVSTAHC